MRLPCKSLVFLIVFTSPLVVAQKQPAAHQASPASWQLPKNADPKAYVGAEVCGACHSPQHAQFVKTTHATAAPKMIAFGTGCESCHGPGKKHAEAMAESQTPTEIAEAKKLIYGFKDKPSENAERCLNCHKSSQSQSFFERSEHKLMGLSCNQCHSAHLVTASAGKKDVPTQNLVQAVFFNLPTTTEEKRWLRESLLKQRQPDLCFGCHKTTQAQFSLPTHHRVPEGLMKCTDCHNSHGTMNQSLLKKANFETCVGCHTEKRGPFVHEHAAVKVEGCIGCHSPHGSIERNMLVRREGRFLCLQCHVNPAGINVPHGRLGFQTSGECVRCHSQIHGSNVSEYFLQ